MMIDNSEDKMFEDLLSDYAQDVPDGGFSTAVLSTQKRHKDTQALKVKAWTIGGAALIGGLIAMSQLPALLQLVSKLSLPATSAPKLSVPSLSTTDLNAAASNIFATPSMLGAAFVMAILAMWLCANMLFGDEV